MKRRLSFGLSAAAVLVAAIGVATSYGAGKGTTTLTMWSYDNQDPGLEPVLKQLSKQFEASHPGVKINLVIKSFNDLVNTIPRALASGSGPDVAEGNQGYQTDSLLVKGKLILPLDKWIKKYHWAKLYSPSTWGMFRWTPDGKSFGKGPIWGVAQSGQNVVVFYNKAKLRSLGVTKLPTTFAAFDKLLAQVRAKLPKDQPVIEEGNKEGYGFIHLFGGIWGAYENPANVRNWVYHVPGSRYDTAATIQALGKLQQWAKAGYFNSDYNAICNDCSSQVFAKGKGVFWIGGDWDSTYIKTGLGKNAGVYPMPPGASGHYASIGGLSGPWHISAKTKYPDLGAAWLNFIITSTSAKQLMFGQQQLPADSSAKPPTNDPYLTQVFNSFTTVTKDNGLLLYTDWASPSMYATLQKQFQLLLAGRTTPEAMAKAVQGDWDKFDKTLR